MSLIQIRRKCWNKALILNKSPQDVVNHSYVHIFFQYVNPFVNYMNIINCRWWKCYKCNQWFYRAIELYSSSNHRAHADHHASMPIYVVSLAWINSISLHAPLIQVPANMPFEFIPICQKLSECNVQIHGSTV